MKTPTPGQIISVARALPEDARVPYGFEKRVMALLRNRAPMDLWAEWSAAMWRAAAACLLISVITGAAVTYAGRSSAELVAADLERTVLAPVDVEDTW